MAVEVGPYGRLERRELKGGASRRICNGRLGPGTGKNVPVEAVVMPMRLVCQNIVYLQYRYRHVRIRNSMERVRGIVREVDNSCSSNPSYFNWLIILRRFL